MTKEINQTFMKYFFVIMLMLPACFSNAQETSKHNPVINQDFPDPTVIRAADGKYYAYATNARHEMVKWINIQVASSTDLFNWTYIGDVLPQKTNRQAPHRIIGRHMFCMIQPSNNM